MPEIEQNGKGDPSKFASRKANPEFLSKGQSKLDAIKRKRRKKLKSDIKGFFGLNGES